MTKLTRFSPTRTMGSLQQEVNRLFDDLFPAQWSEKEDEPYSSAVWSPRADLSETENEYKISVDLPGVPKEAVNVTVEDNRLNISGERKMEQEEKKGTYSRIERSYGRFYRSFSLGSHVNQDEIHAEYNNGILTVHVPKSERVKPQKIEIV